MPEVIVADSEGMLLSNYIRRVESMQNRGAGVFAERVGWSPGGDCMKWTVTLVAETEPGHVRTHELGQIERADTITPASLGLSIAEGKTLVAALQTAIVTAHVERHGEALRPCPHCARRALTSSLPM